MTYTINGKQYTEFDINKRCAEIQYPDKVYYEQYETCRVQIPEGDDFYFNPCNNPSDTDAIIDKCWDELMEKIYVHCSTPTRWENTIEKHNCTKLVAACICLIELNE
jgi:hypothetical protein